MMSLVPPALRDGDTIGLVSPSLRLNNVFESRHQRSMDHLRSVGYKIKEFFTPLPSEATHQQQIAHRVKELHDAFLDDDVSAVVCTSGGDHANELLRHLDYGLIQAKAKIFVGYSDITCLLLAIYTKAGLRTFYGPTPIIEFGDIKPWEFTVEHFNWILRGRSARDNQPMPRSSLYTPYLPKELTDAFGATAEDQAQLTHDSPNWRWLQEGQCNGRIIGGCLPCILQLTGTEWWPALNGSILLLETAMGEAVESEYGLDALRTNLTNLANRNVFQACIGIIFGRPLLPRDPEKIQQYETNYWKIVSEILVSENFLGPVLVNVDVGHTDPMLTVPLGAVCQLNSELDTWELCERPVVRQ